jgi:acyl carrier protein
MTTDHLQLPDIEAIQSWLVAHLAKIIEVSPAEINIQTPFDRYGLDSVAVVTLIGDLEEWLGRELPATLAWDHPNIEELARYLAEPSGE